MTQARLCSIFARSHLVQFACIFMVPCIVSGLLVPPEENQTCPNPAFREATTNGLQERHRAAVGSHRFHQPVIETVDGTGTSTAGANQSFHTGENPVTADLPAGNAQKIVPAPRVDTGSNPLHQRTYAPDVIARCKRALRARGFLWRGHFNRKTR